MNAERLAPAELERTMHRALLAAGANEAMASATARALVAAELQGLPSHGASRIPQYCGHVRNGRANGKATPRVVRERGGACLVDAGGGLAFGACELAIAEVVRRAKAHGVAFASVTNSNHFGVAAWHLEPVAAAGLVGLGFGNSPAAMPAWGGKRPLFGTNPVAAVFPRRDGDALSIDLSLSAVARGKIMVAARDGKPIPEGWAVDAEGQPTRDAKAALAGSMLPAGGVKGAMLAMIVELLACALSGAAYGFESDSFFTPEGKPTRIGQGFMAIDPDALAGREMYIERVETLIAAMLQDEGVRLPGSRRAELARRNAAGIEVQAELMQQIRRLAGEGAGA